MASSDRSGLRLGARDLEVADQLEDLGGTDAVVGAEPGQPSPNATAEGVGLRLGARDLDDWFQGVSVVVGEE